MKRPTVPTIALLLVALGAPAGMAASVAPSVSAGMGAPVTPSAPAGMATPGPQAEVVDAATIDISLIGRRIGTETYELSRTADGVTLRLRRPNPSSGIVYNGLPHIWPHILMGTPRSVATRTAMSIRRSTDGSEAVYKLATSLLLRSTASVY